MKFSDYASVFGILMILVSSGVILFWVLGTLMDIRDQIRDIRNILKDKK